MRTSLQPTLSRMARNASMSANPGLWQGLVGAWVPALGIQGGMLVDASGGGMHGATTAPVYGPSGAYQSMVFSGTPVIIPAAARIHPAAAVSVVVRMANTSASFAMLFGNNGTAGGYYNLGGVCLAVNTASLRLVLPGTTSATSGDRASGIVAGVPITVSGTYDGATGRIYAAGAQTYEWATSGAITGQSGAIIGREGSGRYAFAGSIAAVYLYGRALLPVEIAKFNADILAPWRLRSRTVGYAPAAGPTFKAYFIPRRRIAA